MSAPEARLSYDMEKKMKKTATIPTISELGLESKVDGVVGATFPKIIQYCSKLAGKKLNIYSQSRRYSVEMF